MRVNYELRTMRDARIFSYDNLIRAREAMAESEKRIGVKLRLIKITHVEEELA